MTSQTNWMGQFAGERIERSETPSAISRTRAWAGRIISGLAVVFLLIDGAMKLVKPASVLEASQRLGYPVSTLSGIGIVLIGCTLLYMIPRTRMLGAILLTGYLGGAVATQVRAESGQFEVLFPVIFGALVWGGQWLRDGRLPGFLPVRGAARAWRS